YANTEYGDYSKQSQILTHYNYKNINLNDIFIIEEKIDNENDEYFRSNIKYPYLKIKDNYINKEDIPTKIIDNINIQISNTINEFKNKIKKTSEDYKKTYEKEDKKDQYPKYQYEAISDYKIEFNKSNILSIPLTMYEFTGGAHGLTTIKSFNYDVSTGKEIKLKDLFKENSNYKEVINKHISEEISKNPSVYFVGEEGFKGISDIQTFYIDDEGLVIYFSLYDIAPYSTGIPTFTITWDEIIDYLENPTIAK
ncbi:MAG: DUF3298 and DUF4163 domain-containing protein, partial [Paraclostridium sp.]